MYRHVECDEGYYDWLIGKKNLKDKAHSTDLGASWWRKLKHIVMVRAGYM
jgi:hypothetical protein